MVMATTPGAPSAADLVERAKALQPALRARVPEAERLRRLPDATIAEFHEAGFFRMLQPARFGGLEVHPQAFFDVQRTVGQACPSSAWVLGVVAVHNWQLALFDLRAQEEVWSRDTRVLVSSSYAPTGTIERADGGFRVSGRWSFSSGCDHCDWVFLGGFAPVEPGRPPDMRTFLLPKSDYRIEDNWHTAALKGTGSKDIVVDGAFVPEHRTHRLIDGFRCKNPGNAVNPAALFRLPFGQIFVRSVSTTAIGIAEGALAAFREAAAKRVAASDGSRVADDVATQHTIARAASLVDEVKLVLQRNMDELMAAAREGREATPEWIARRVQFRYESALAVEKCVEAVDLLFTASGGRAIFLDHPLLRFFLDVHAARAHYANNPDKPGRNFGAVQLGQKSTDFFI